MILLEVRQAGSTGFQPFSSEKPLVTLGRHSSNDLQILDDAASRFHAEIERLGDAVFVRDLDSRNGVFVNESPVLERQLHEGDEIRIGDTRIRYRRSGEAQLRRESGTTDVVVLPPAPAAEPGEETGPAFTGRVQMPAPAQLAIELIELMEEGEKGAAAGAQADPDRLKRLTLAARLAEALASTGDVDSLLDHALFALERAIPYHRGAVLLWDGDSQAYLPRAARRATPASGKPEDRIAVSMTIANYCIEHREGVACMDAMNDPRFATAQSVFDLRLRSVVCAPILGAEQPLGVIQLDAWPKDALLAERELKIAMLAANLLAPAIERRLAWERRRLRERLADQTRVVAAASQYFQNHLFLLKEQGRVLREAVRQGNQELTARVADQLAASYETTSAALERFADYVRGGVNPAELVDLNELIAGLLDELAPALEEKQIQVEFTPDERLTATIADREALRLALLNLLTNALDSLAGRPTRVARVKTERAGDRRAVIVIQDTGEGMTEAALARAFEPFFTTRPAPRVGLGLAYARQILTAHDGTISLQSQPDKGTTVTLALPLRTQPPAPAPSRPGTPWLLG